MFISGCFQAKGASVGDIFVVSDCAFHDRRIPIPVSVMSFLLVALAWFVFSFLPHLKCNWLQQFCM